MIKYFYRTVQVLSLDIVIGVVILLRFFCAQFGVVLSWHVYALLAISVWIIYTVDHLQDARKAPNSDRYRYRFHLENKRLLQIAIICCLLIVIPLVYYIPRMILFGGIILGGLSFIYLLVQQRLSAFLFKELYVAVVYSVGVLMAPFLLSGTYAWSVFLSLFLLTFSNLIIFSWFEVAEDLKDGFQSLSTRLGQGQVQKLIIILISVGISISLISDHTVFVFFLISFAIYALIAIKPTWFGKNFRYRFVGDSVFMLPIICEWM